MSAQRGQKVLSAREWLEGPDLSRLVTRVAARYGIGPTDLQDLLQETRIALWEAGSTGTFGSAWVWRVASNKAVNLVRKATRARAGERELAFPNEHSKRDPELEPLLRVRITELPPALREFYDLHYVQGWSERETAGHLNMCRASVRWLDHRCLRAITGPRPDGSRRAATR
jgi:RNA polymerase sigma factor (sigma-70 family)